MKRLQILIAMASVLGFWACGDGDMEMSTNADKLAIEKFSHLTEGEINKAITKCRGDDKCLAAYEEALILDSLERLTHSSSAEPESSEDAESSSSKSNDKTRSSSSKTEKHESSSSETLSSSSENSSDSSTKSSAGEKSSSSVSSSSEEQGSSSALLPPPPSSDDGDEPEEPILPPSSSSVGSSSSVEPEPQLDPPAGTCTASPTSVKTGESVTWTYQPIEGTKSKGHYEWLLDNSAFPFYDEGEDKVEVTVVYTTGGSMNATQIYLDGEEILDKNGGSVCGAVTVIVTGDVFVPSSSSGVDEPLPSSDSQIQPGTSSSTGGNPILQ